MPTERIRQMLGQSGVSLQTLVQMAEEFPYLDVALSKQLPGGCLSEDEFEAGTYSEFEEVEPDIWLSDRDAKTILGFDAQVFWRHEGYLLTLLLAELDEEEYSATSGFTLFNIN